MDGFFKNILKMFKTNESAISQALGALVVVLVGVLLFNYFKDNKPTPEITDEAEQTVATNQNVELMTDEEGKFVPKGLPTTHTVVMGDNLWKISEKYYGNGYNWVDIAEANNLSNANIVNEGVQLTIPAVPLRYDKEVQMTGSTAIPASDSLLDAGLYTVQKGDHLWSIALRAYGDGYKWMDIYKENQKYINDPNKLEIGMSLVLPR